MIGIISSIGIGLGGIVLLVIAVVVIRKTSAGTIIRSAQKEASRLLDESNKEAKRIVSKAQGDSQRIQNEKRKELENENKTRRQAVADLENRASQKEKYLAQKEDQLDEKESWLEKEKDKIKELKRKEEEIIASLSGKLEKIAELSKEDAEKLLLQNVEKECKQKAGRIIKDIESNAKKIANRRAKEIITDAIQRTAVDHVSSLTTTMVNLPDDDMKGRVIGKEGRNIRAFEAATGVDIIIDDSPGTIIVSAFDPIRREIAKMALESLLEDGRIHPARIEEAVDKARSELKNICMERGEKAAEQVGQEFHPSIIEYLGKLYYRSSYGQNMWYHALESAHIAGIIATQLGVNPYLAKRGALLHDIGKAIDFEKEGSHTQLGKDICLQAGESPEILNCIMAHHEEEEPDTIEAIIVMVADAISSVRPGARREATEAYVKRLEKLEAIASAFDGVETVYAIQAGREVRVIVRPEEVNDDGAAKLAFDIAKQIENEVDYPGEVKVSIIRETRAFGIAH
jgi:ribonucrease Y